jgi:hypothetical protein
MGLALLGSPARAQEEAPAEPKPTYQIQPPPTAAGQRVAVRDTFKAQLYEGKRPQGPETGFVQEYEDAFQRPKHGNRVSATRTWQRLEDVQGKLPGEAAGVECGWGLGPTGLYWQHLQDHELPPLVAEALRSERDQAGCMDGSLNMPAGLNPAEAVRAGAAWDVSAPSLARWGRVLFGDVMVAQRANARLTGVEEGETGPVLKLRFKGRFTVSSFFPLGFEKAISRPTAVTVDVKVKQPTTWEVGGDPFEIELEAEAMVGLPDGKELRVEHRWSREVRRLE